MPSSQTSSRATSISTTRSSTARSSHQTTPADRSSMSSSGGPGGQPTSRLSCYGSTVPICALYAQRAPAAAASRSAAGIARTFALSEGLSVEKRGRQLFGVIGQPRLRRVPMRAFGCSIALVAERSDCPKQPSTLTEDYILLLADVPPEWPLTARDARWCALRRSRRCDRASAAPPVLSALAAICRMNRLKRGIAR